ncbi:FHA domain-containing protein [Vibrio sp. ZSDZ65]|uniref:FHA domain-containing protein n=1 Tax=Vibrio qingdaonensis TaxID=2829491 RepID=A0A9X3CS40_9VIBR|nr:FHA domain-containing protein [Vibrio qingdaonensis]MCW8348643.1 FHA domain-containing protein [Vibrio qingdaonensis]
MRLNQLVLFISKCPEEYVGVKQFEMPESGGSIGRSAGCTLSLIDHNRFISGTHCLISVYGDTFYISDVSTNGILVNGNKILKNQPVSICDGDIISMGQYEISIALEQVVATQDIASDIAPERDSTDPLVNLGEVVVEESVQVGSLEDIFMETKLDEIESHDPVAHLQFSMHSEDDHLISDENNLESSQVNSINNSRQIVDDSLSIHSEIELSSLIPEDWMGMEKLKTQLEQDQDKPDGAFIHHQNAYSSEKGKVEGTHPSLEGVGSKPRQLNVGEDSRQKWEEVTQPFVPTAQEPTPHNEKEITSNLQGELGNDSSQDLGQFVVTKDLAQAFCEGLGINEADLISKEPEFFKQMGTCLRLCMDNLQKELREIELIKDEPENIQQEANLTELMLILNSQDLLAPTELIEQMLDELQKHRTIYSKAVSDLLIKQSTITDPMRFEDDYVKGSIFTTKSKLWSEYTEFYTHKRRQLHETSLQGQIKEIYNKSTKESHA